MSRQLPDYIRDIVPESMLRKASTHEHTCACGGARRMAIVHDCVDCARGKCQAATSGVEASSDGGGHARLTMTGHDIEGCPSCFGTGHILVSDGPYTHAEPCPGQALRQRVDAFNRARFPGRYVDATFANVRGYDRAHLSVIARVETWTRTVKPGGLGLMLHGVPRNGQPFALRTHLLTAAGRMLTLERGYSAAYCEWPSLLNSLRSSFRRRDDDDDVSPLDALASVQFLFIDELGSPPVDKQWREDALWSLLSARYDNPGLTTVVSTNFTRETDSRRPLVKQVGRRMMSRLIELTEDVSIATPEAV